MKARYRSWADREQIVAAVIAEGATRPLSDFALDPGEEAFFRGRSRRILAETTRKTSTFTAFYRPPISKPFLYILGLTLIVVAFGLAAGGYLFLQRRADTHLYPLLGSCATITVAAIGWCVAAWISHRNAVRQNTTNIIFARFSQTAFTDSLHRFHTGFGHGVDEVVTKEKLTALRAVGDDSARAAEAVNYLLNYYEYLSAGILKGDLDAEIIRTNLRGSLIYYFDKCAPYIRFCNAQNRKAFENLIRMRAHYREP